MKAIKMGAVSYKSIKAAVEAVQSRNPGMSYMTAYMRIRAGKKIGSALQKKPRQYTKKLVQPYTGEPNYSVPAVMNGGM